MGNEMAGSSRRYRGRCRTPIYARVSTNGKTREVPLSSVMPPATAAAMEQWCLLAGGKFSRMISEGGYDLSPDFLPRLLKEQIDNMRGIARKNNLPLLAILEIGTAALDLLGKSPDDIDDDVYRRFDAIRDQHLITNTELGDILYDLVSVFK